VKKHGTQTLLSAQAHGKGSEKKKRGGGKKSHKLSKTGKAQGEKKNMERSRGGLNPNHWTRPYATGKMRGAWVKSKDQRIKLPTVAGGK